jgi:hypothetical protein
MRWIADLWHKPVSSRSVAIAEPGGCDICSIMGRVDRAGAGCDRPENPSVCGTLSSMVVEMVPVAAEDKTVRPPP